MSKVRIRRLDPSVELPRYATAGSAAFDLAASEETAIAPGEVRLVPTGLVIEVPAGMFLGVFARSSTPLKKGLMVANGVGVVDSDYCGPTDEIKVPDVNVTSAGGDQQRRSHRAGDPAAVAPDRVGRGRRARHDVAWRVWRDGTVKLSAISYQLSVGASRSQSMDYDLDPLLRAES